MKIIFKYVISLLFVFATIWITFAWTKNIKHTFYTSSHYKSFLYYCDTDSEWNKLSKRYLKSFPSEIALKKKYPNKKLHEPCK